MKKTVVLFLFCFCLEAASGQNKVKIMTFNIRYDNPADGEFAWQKRIPLVKDLMLQERPDIIGFQEVLENQVDDLLFLLPGYSWSGVGRDDGKKKGEYAAVFYRSNRFEKLDGSTFWLSETPEIPGSRSWNAACTRIVTWVKLKDKTSRQVLFVFNTHFDHASPAAREESAKLLLRDIRKIAGSQTSFITGDFNDTVNSPAIRILTSGGLEDTRILAGSAADGPGYTFGGFPFHPQKGETIDFIFL
jgi:endonuclease/exonuclease/phosphatase family metal-dependent hydrolase